MDTASIRNFAVMAREKLLAGVDERLNALGFAADGSVSEENRPVAVEGGARFRGTVISDPTFYGKWSKLAVDVSVRGRTEVRDAAAYTWFNRFCAIRILAKRGFIPVALEYTGNKDARTPALVASMRAGEQLPPLTVEERQRLEKIRFDDTKTTEQFAILVTALCRDAPVIRACFGATLDYTDLLLPQDILAPGGFVDALNDPAAISDADYCTDELIGWLYQYYISERKQEVFDSFKLGRKAAAEDIPAATQIFTPNWIVKYMVQNSLGRLAIENDLGGDFTDDWKYLIREEDGTHPPCLHVDSPEELTMADIACGSGHILLEGFRHLQQIYAEAGYSKRQAVENIFTKNLLGVDLDMRARQLSQFVLLLAAMSADPSFSDAHVLPRVFDMEGTLPTGAYSRSEIAQVLAIQEDGVLGELMDAFELLTQAHNLGSIMKFKISDRTRGILAVKVGELAASETDDLAAKYLPSFKLILTLTDHYAAIVTNPPYMGNGNMNVELKAYLEAEYADGKADLMTVFMMFASAHTIEKGRWAMINLPSWMFLGSFEKLRRNFVNNEQIVGLVHNGRGVFGSDFGSVTFVVSNMVPSFEGYYRRLFTEHVEVRSVEKIQRNFLDKGFGVFRTDQRCFSKIPGCPVAYWVSNNVRQAFDSFQTIGQVAEPKQGSTLGDNAKFIRLWHEIGSRGRKWFPCMKGGPFRKWYGNCYYVVDWENNGERVKRTGRATIRSEEYLFRRAITWPHITSGKSSFRFMPEGYFFESCGTVCFVEADKLMFLLGFLNTPIANLLNSAINPTFCLQSGDVAKLPVIGKVESLKNIDSIVSSLVSRAQKDWDSFEISWDFKSNPLVSKGISELTSCYALVCSQWKTDADEMRQEEEENNRLFIEAYGLQAELGPCVPIHEISLTSNPWYRYGVKEGEKTWEELLQKQKADTIKELISYAIGCLMGRYSLAKEGLILASQGETIEDYWKKIGRSPSADEKLVPDDDGIIPVLAGAHAFTDNATQRVVDFVRAAFGVEKLNENLNFIEESLGTTLENYLVKEFWKDHKKMYQNRPIYWLFSSKKGAFQALVYMHRMDAYTASKVRGDYLLPHIEFLRTRIATESARGAELTARERTALKKMQQALDECLEYDGRLHVVADKMQTIDLDDGVLVNYPKFGDVLAKLK